MSNEMSENIRELSRYISGKINSLNLKIPEVEISRNDTIDMKNNITSIDPEKRKESKIDKSTLWHEHKRIKEGKTITIHNKTKLMIG